MWISALHGAIGSRRVSQDGTVVKLTHMSVTRENRSGLLHSWTGSARLPLTTREQSMYWAQLSLIATMAVGFAWQYGVASAEELKFIQRSLKSVHKIFNECAVYWLQSFFSFLNIFVCVYNSSSKEWTSKMRIIHCKETMA